MKIRQGFVSNSSSSSFVIITTKENHEKAIKNSHPFVQAVMKALGGKSGKFKGIDVVSSGTLSVQDTGLEDWLSVEYDGERPKGEYDDEMSYSEAFDKYCDEVGKNKKEILTVSLDG